MGVDVEVWATKESHQRDPEAVGRIDGQAGQRSSTALAGLSPHRTPGPPTEDVIAFYERMRNHVDDVLSGLRDWDQP